MGNGNALHFIDRRRFLGLCGQAALLGLMPKAALADLSTPAPDGFPLNRTLRLLNTHTGERLTCSYLENGRFVPDALAAINHILRDHRNGEIKPIDPALLDLMSTLSERVGESKPFHIVSGYRSPATNEALRRSGRKVARRSYHLQGRAVDLRLPGVALADLKAAALTERTGGVGYYPGRDFVHIDTGPVRTW